MNSSRRYSPGTCAALACICEVLAPKAGNVHPQASFSDATWNDFVNSAVACTLVFEQAKKLGVGATILSAVRATKRVTASNTNLGMILLLAPLCAASVSPGDLRDQVRAVLRALSPEDARDLYQAIREANPGGLGRADRGDVQHGEVLPILEAMKLAADRDAVALQYVTDFATIFDHIVPDLIAAQRHGLSLEDVIVRAHLQQMARQPDSLIGRKCGVNLAGESAQRAAQVLAARWPENPASLALFNEFDRWLRAEEHRRNPGTSADLIAAGLFVAFMQGDMVPTPQALQLFTSHHSNHRGDD